MPKRFVVLAAVLGLAACAGDTSPLELLVRAKDGVEKIGDGMLDTAARQIDNYCAIPLEGRLRLREAVNTRTTQGDMRVTCQGDPPPPAPPPVVQTQPPPRVVRPAPARVTPVQPRR